MFVALTPNQAQADHELLPSAPTNLLAKPADGNAGRTSLVLTWTAPERGPVTGYRIDYSTDNVEYMELVANSESTATTYTHTGLKPGTLYVYRVFAINSGGTGLVSETYSTMTDGVAGEPDDVIGLTAARATTTPEKWSEINLSWTEPYGGGVDITGYCIEIVDDPTPWPDDSNGCRAGTLAAATFAASDDGTAAGTVGVILPEGTMTTYTDKGLDAGERRYYRVFAITGEDTARSVSEMPSNRADAMTATAVKPNAPTGLRAAKTADNSTVNLYWYWPASDGGDDITSFRIEVSTQSNRWPKATEANTADAANNITENQFDGATLTSTGTAANDNGVLVDRAVGDADSNAASEQATHTHAVRALADAGRKTLYYRVFTQTATGRSTHSNTASVTINHGINPVAPTTTGDGNGATAGDGKIDLAWSATDYNHDNDDGTTPVIPYPASGYRIDYAEGKADTATNDELMWKPLWGNTGFTDTEFTHTPLKPSTRVYYRIFTIGSNQVISIAPAPISDTTEAAGALGKVRNVMAVANDATKITVTWDAPENLGVHEVDHYSIQMAMQGSIPTFSAFTSENTKTTMGPVTMFMHTNLTQNQTWLYRVAAVAKGRDLNANALAKGEYSSWANATTPAAAKPDAPIGLLAEDARDSSLTAPGELGVLLIWNMPEGPAGSIVHEYEIERKVEGEDSDFKELATVDATFNNVGDTLLVPPRTSYTDMDEPDLDEGEVRHYRVRAVSNSDVEGEWAMVRFPSDRMHGPAPELDNPMLTATEGTGSVTLMWNEQAAAVEYTVWGVRSDGSAVRDGSTEALIRMDDITGTSYEVTGLMSGEEYWFAVTACDMADCDAGNYLHSNVVVATPD